MKRKLALFVLLALWAAFCLAGCNKSRIASTWINPEYQGGPPKRIMVVGMCTDPTTKEMFESILAAGLLKNGVSAVTGFENLPCVTEQNKELIKEKCRNLGVDAVLTARLVSVEEAPGPQPPPTFEATVAPQPFDGYIAKPTAMGIETGTFKRRTFVRLQTRLFDLETEQQIWSARTNVVDPKSTYDMFEDMSAEILEKLRKEKLIGRK